MFNLPEILTIVIGALLALVFIDGIRRAIRIKRSSLKVDLIDVEEYVSKDFEEEWMQGFSDEPSEQEFEDKEEEMLVAIKPSSSLLILHLSSQRKDQFSKDSITEAINDLNFVYDEKGLFTILDEKRNLIVAGAGTGKTTTAAKIAHRLQSNGHSVIAAAGDTFRAGAIQQLESHCENLGIRCISSQRGGDAAAIARDAIESAKAKGIDVVLVDTAGRMQNKTNLMKELEKVRRVADPHLVLFVGDALAGNDAVDQAKMFQEMMKFDGAVLSKMDTDAKGGAGLSIAYATGRPIVFAGIGQGYDDLLQFNPDWLLDEMFS